MALNPEDMLSQGKTILDPLLEPMEFRFHLTEGMSRGSGGDYAVGAYSRNASFGLHRLELHCRRALGVVVYQMGDYKLLHADYMKFLGVYDQTAYPGFSDDPMDGFRHLCSDLERFCSDFLTGRGYEAFKAYAIALKQRPNLLKRIR